MKKIKNYSIYESYLNAVQEKLEDPKSTEISYYTPIENFFGQLIEAFAFKNYTITMDSKKIGENKPDIIIKQNQLRNVAFGEVKKPQASEVGSVKDYLKTDQVKRYRENFDNFFLMDTLEFIFFRQDADGTSKKIGQFKIIDDSAAKLSLDDKEIEKFDVFISTYFNFTSLKIKNTKDLSFYLAVRTRILAASLVEIIQPTIEAKVSDPLKGIMEQVSKDLEYPFKLDAFCDFFAQTLVFGYLFAWFDSKGKGFVFSDALKLIPKSQGTLSVIFHSFHREDVWKLYENQVEWILDDIEFILTCASDNAVQIFKEIQDSIDAKLNPLLYFYEDFIKVVDPGLQRQGGVYFTPIEIVQFIIRSTNEILIREFGKKNGLIDKDIKVLDPAGGTGTFFCQIINEIHDLYKKRLPEFKQLITGRLIPNYYFFEIMISALSIGTYNFVSLLKSYGMDDVEEKSLNFFATNTLDIKEEKLKGMTLIPVNKLDDANTIKKDTHLLVILGNPPYGKEDAENRTTFVEKELVLYYVRETNPKLLNDMYVEFIRFAHYKIEQNKSGIIAFITNNSFLDGNIHRGMRHELMKSFDEIYVYNLHGEMKEQKVTQDDQNVFSIRQGVCISFFIKSGKKKTETDIKVQYADLWGKQSDKHHFLSTHNIYDSSIGWKTLYTKIPLLDSNYFIPFSTSSIYDSGISIYIIFVEKSSGIKSGEKDFMIAPRKEDLLERLVDAKRSNYKHLRREDIKSFIEPISFHPFDLQFIFKFDTMLSGNRTKFYKKIDQETTPILTLIREREKFIDEWKHYMVCTGYVDLHLFDSSASSVYLYPLAFNEKPNIEPSLLTFLYSKYSRDIGNATVFYYIIGILTSKWYRVTFHDQLKLNFQKIPFPADYATFEQLSKFGENVSDCHLLKMPPDPFSIIYLADSAKVKVEKVGADSYDGASGKYKINSSVFLKISKEAWEFYIGTFYPVKQWLIERENFELDIDEIEHLRKIVANIESLISIESKINEYLAANPFSPMEMRDFYNRLLTEKLPPVIKRKQRGGFGYTLDEIKENLSKIFGPIDIPDLDSRLVEILKSIAVEIKSGKFVYDESRKYKKIEQ